MTICSNCWEFRCVGPVENGGLVAKPQVVKRKISSSRKQTIVIAIENDARVVPHARLLQRRSEIGHRRQFQPASGIQIRYLTECQKLRSWDMPRIVRPGIASDIEDD